MKKILLVILGVILFAPSCSYFQTERACFDSIMPRPAYIDKDWGHFTLEPGVGVVAEDSSLRFEAEWLRNFLGSDGAGEGSGLIRLRLDNLPDSLGDEGYILEVTQKGVDISARSSAGVFYGIQSLRQMLPADLEKEGITQSVHIQKGRIIDYPRFKWRGLLLDCCRHFMEKDFVKRYIDLLALHKMNRLHWHLTEDQGWRIEIKKYPKLTEVGAWRMEEDGSRYGGYYTQEDIREVVAYAAQRHIEVIPEIEMPGHSVAALASYPELSCTGGPFAVENSWGVFKDIYCAGNEQVFGFLQDVLTEVADLFPAKYIHVGGDEAPRYRWEQCPRCQERMKNEGLEKEAQLQTYFIKRISDFLATKGKKVIGWDEIIEGGLMEGATVQSWRGMEGAEEAIRHGHDAIVSPTSHAYFDYSIATTDVRKVYSFEPIPENAKPDEVKHILGGECNMWTERAPQELIDQRLFPRIIAMSEVLWSPKEQRDFKQFSKRLDHYYARLDILGIDYGAETQLVKIKAEHPMRKDLLVSLLPQQKKVGIKYALKTPSGDTLLSGTSLGPIGIHVWTDAILDVEANAGRDHLKETYHRTFAFHQLIGLKPSYLTHYSSNYTAGGDYGLTDGQFGTLMLRDGLWQGYEGDDMKLLFDLGGEDSIRYISASFLQANPSWVFMPTSVTFQISSSLDGPYQSFTFTPTTDIKETENTREEIGGEIGPVVGRYVRVKAKNVGVCPSWHPGAGGKCWIFVDEIVVK